MKQLHLINVKM